MRLLKRTRNKRGALILLSLAMSSVIGVLILFSIHLAFMLIEHERYQRALEAAALKAASDLSRIVVNDPYFGFVSLSDYPAIGQGTKAGDGEPLPVHGINTIIATTRLDYMIAREIGDENLEKLALEDARHAKETVVQLNKTLEQALKSNGGSNIHDIDGNPVRVYEDTFNVYVDNVQSFGEAKTQEFKLTLGWLNSPGQTITSKPVVNSKGNVNAHAGNADNQYYQSYLDMPVGNEHFLFAGLGNQPLLVNMFEFVSEHSQTTDKDSAGAQGTMADPSHLSPEQYKKYLSSIVAVQATWQCSDLLSWGHSAPTFITSRACAQPYGEVSRPVPSILVVAFPDGRPQGINSLVDLFSNGGLGKSTMNVYTPVSGDFPADSQAYLQPSDTSATPPSATDVFTQTFYDWLRSNYTLPSIGATIDTLQAPFDVDNKSFAGECTFVIEITADGSLAIARLNLNPFADLRANEDQLYALNDTPATLGNTNWTVVCRDQVHNLGTMNGGNHAGQPMSGNPVNWSELDTYVNPGFMEAVKGRKQAGITLVGDSTPDGGIQLGGSKFVRDDGKELPQDLRKTAYFGGLAGEIRISSPVVLGN